MKDLAFQILSENYATSYNYYEAMYLREVNETLQDSQNTNPEYWEQYPNSSQEWGNSLERSARNQAADRAVEETFFYPYTGKRKGLAALLSIEEIEGICGRNLNCPDDWC